MSGDAHGLPARPSGSNPELAGEVEAGRRRPIVVHVMTDPVSLFFLSGQAAFLKGAGLEVHAVASPGPALDRFGRQERVPVHAIAMTRAITPLRDLWALWRLCRELRRLRPQIVHAHTAKGGLLGMVAASLTGVPVRVYHVRGLRFVTTGGVRRRLLICTEWLSCKLAHRVLAIGPSVRRIAVELGLCPPGKIRVLLGGGNGVDAVTRFVPRDAAARATERARLGIPADALVVGFVGRFVRDKGVIELARAWARLREAEPRVHLLVVGRTDAPGAPAEIVALLRADARVHVAGVVWETPPLYAAMDVLALPTYREGFPNVLVEAAAMALPVVATHIPGCDDAVQDGVTGTLVPPQDAGALAAALLRYLSDPALRARHGAAGRRRVLADFRREQIWEATASEYRALLAERTGAPGSRPLRATPAARERPRRGGLRGGAPPRPSP